MIINPTVFSLSPFSPGNMIKMGMHFPILTSFVFFFLLPLIIFIGRGMEDQKAILIASAIGYFMYIAFAYELPIAVEFFETLERKNEKM